MPPLLRGVLIFLLFGFFCVIFFGHAASPEACRELSDLSGSCSVGKLFLGSRRVGGSVGDESVHGIVIQCLLYFSEF